MSLDGLGGLGGLMMGARRSPSWSIARLGFDAFDAWPAADKYTVAGASTTQAGFFSATGLAFSRASDAQYVNVNGLWQTVGPNVIRRTWKNGVALGWWFEGARTNLCTKSEELNTWGVLASTVTADATTAPDGEDSADLVTEMANLTVHYIISSAITITADSVITFSFWVKPNGRSQVGCRVRGSEGRAVRVDFYTATLTKITFNETVYTVIASGVEEWTDGWYRCWLTVQTATDTAVDLSIYLLNNGQASYEGDGTSGAYIWGVQAETGNFRTSYIRTGGSTATRGADSLTRTISSAPEGSVVLRFRTAPGFDQFNQVYWALDDNSVNNFLWFYRYSGDSRLRLYCAANGSPQSVADLGALSDDTEYVVGAKWSDTEFSARLNNGVWVNGTAAPMPEFTRERIGHGIITSSYGTVARIARSSKALPDEAIEQAMAEIAA